MVIGLFVRYFKSGSFFNTGNLRVAGVCRQYDKKKLEGFSAGRIGCLFPDAGVLMLKVSECVAVRAFIADLHPIYVTVTVIPGAFDALLLPLVVSETKPPIALTIAPCAVARERGLRPCRKIKRQIIRQAFSETEGKPE
jgi:hypothetical protein